jgi:hypothetical protein
MPTAENSRRDTNREAAFSPAYRIFSTIIGRLKLKGVRGFHLLGEPQPPERHAEQNGPHFAIGLDLSQLEASPRFFSEIQYVSSNLQYVVHRTHPHTRRSCSIRYVGRRNCGDKLAIVGDCVRSLLMVLKNGEAATQRSIVLA